MVPGGSKGFWIDLLKMFWFGDGVGKTQMSNL